MKKAFLLFLILAFALGVNLTFTSCKPAAETAAAKVKAAMLTDVGGLS